MSGTNLYQVYVIRNTTGKFYIGLNENVQLRLRQHNQGVSKWTRYRGPWSLVWESESLTLSQARKLENRLKRQKGGRGFRKLMGLPGSSGSLSRRAGIEPVIGVLPAGGQFYTNARITSVTPAHAVVSFDGGIVQLALSNLPASCQKKYGYDPDKAAKYLAEEKQKLQERRAALMARQAAYNQGVALLAGTNRPVQIVSILDEVSNGGIPRCAVSDVPDTFSSKIFPTR
jgi:putative endonuclease